MANAEEMHDDRRRPRLRDTWPIGWREAGLIVAAYVLMTAAWTGLGHLVTGPLDDSSLVRADERVARWFVDERTSGWNDLSLVGSWLSETLTKIVVTAIAALVMLRIFRRWLEPLVIVVPLVLEAAVFITSTVLVGRERPDVPRLDTSPVGSSFPSGHVAAAVVYSAAVVIVFWHTRNRWARGGVLALCVVVPVAVGLARMYRGMHYLSDVVAGALLGLVTTIVTTLLLTARQRREGIGHGVARGHRAGDAPAMWRGEPARPDGTSSVGQA